MLVKFYIENNKLIFLGQEIPESDLVFSKVLSLTKKDGRIVFCVEVDEELRKRSKTLDELVQLSQEMGLYE
jgi:hypothetical protein